MAKELRARGVEVTVLTGMPNYPIGRIFPGYRGKVTSREQVDGIAVHRVCLYPAAGRGSARRLLNYLSFTLTAGLRLLFMPRVANMNRRPMRFIVARYDLTFPVELSHAAIAEARRHELPLDVVWLPCGHYGTLLFARRVRRIALRHFEQTLR